MKQTLGDMKIHFDQPVTINCDNTSAISLSKNLVMHSKSKHIPIKYHFLREQDNEQQLTLKYVNTKEQVANIFTKPSPKDTFEYIRQRLEVISLQD